MPSFKNKDIPEEARRSRPASRSGISRPRVIYQDDSVAKIVPKAVPNPVDIARDYVSLPNSQTLGMYSKTYDTLRKSYMHDGYIRQTVDKIAEKLFSNVDTLAECIDSEDDELKKFIVARLNYISEAQGYSLKLRFVDIIRRLVRDGVAYCIKGYTRNPIRLLGYDVEGVYNKKPIGGLFLLESTSMSPILNKDNGHIVGFVYEEQVQGTSRIKKILSLEDIYVFKYSPEGINEHGISQVYTALEDIRGLRNIEDATLKLIYRHLNPLIHVSTPDTSDDGAGDQADVNRISQVIAEMAHDGFLVTGPGYAMKSIGAESQALRASDYLSFFKNRSLASLNSAPLFTGDAQYINDAGARILVEERNDRIRFYKLIMEEVLTQEFLKDLLTEINEPLMDRETGEFRVKFRIPEFDLDRQVKVDNHYTDLFTKNMITRTEGRARLSPKYRPLSIEEEKDTFMSLSGKVDQAPQPQEKPEGN